MHNLGARTERRRQEEQEQEGKGERNRRRESRKKTVKIGDRRTIKRRMKN
jgi:hypothetical protein